MDRSPPRSWASAVDRFWAADGHERPLVRDRAVNAWERRLATESDTLGLGEALGRQLRAGDLVGLCGPLGAGKTTFVRGLAKGLDIHPATVVRSPSFTLCHEYRGRLTVLHQDWYRLHDARQADALDLLESTDRSSVGLVEWADLFPSVLPPHTIWVRMDPLGEGRRVRITDGTGNSRWVAELVDPDSLEDGWTAVDTPTPWAP